MTLRARLGAAAAVIVLVMSLGGWAVLRIVSQAQRDQLDRSITDNVRGALRSVPPSGSTDKPAPATFSQLYIARLDEFGERTVFARPSNVGDAAPVLPAALAPTAATFSSLNPPPSDPGRGPGGPGTTRRGTTPTVIVDADSLGQGTVGWRVAVVREDIGPTLLIAVPRTAADEAEQRTLWAMVFVAAAGLATFGISAWWVIRLGIRPIDQLAEVARDVSAGDRSRRATKVDRRTEAGQLGDAFNLMLDDRQRTEDRLRRLLADISHELRTPIASIGGFADLYRLGGLAGDDALTDAMRRIGAESSRMAGLVNDLLLLADLDEHRALALSDLDIADLLDDVALDASATHPSRPVTVDAQRPLILQGDEARLRQVVSNLVANAFAHAGATATVQLGGRVQHGRCLIEVVDDGVGMTAEEADRATDRLWRGDPSRTRASGGAGLGLSIALSIVEAHRGRLTIRSRPTKGTTVLVDLPLSTSADGLTPSTAGINPRR